MSEYTQPWKQNRDLMEYRAQCTKEGLLKDGASEVVPFRGMLNPYPKGTMVFQGGKATGHQCRMGYNRRVLVDTEKSSSDHSGFNS